MGVAYLGTHKYLHIGFCIDGRLSFKHYYTISQVCSHYEIVLHNKCSFLGMQNKPTKQINQ